MAIRVFIISLILDFSALLFSFHAIPKSNWLMYCFNVFFYTSYTLISDRKLFCLLIFTVIIKRYMRGYSIPFLLIIKLVELILEKKDFDIWSLKRLNSKHYRILRFISNFWQDYCMLFFFQSYTLQIEIFLIRWLQNEPETPVLYHYLRISYTDLFFLFVV